MHQLITITGDLIAQGGDLQGLDAFIRNKCVKECAFYVRSTTMDSITCGSGEYDGKPFVFGGCNRCVVGQFTSSGQFIGQLVESENADTETSTEE